MLNSCRTLALALALTLTFLQEVIQTTGVTYDPRKRDVCRTWFEPRTNRLSNPGLQLQARIPDEHACYSRVRA